MATDLFLVQVAEKKAAKNNKPFYDLTLLQEGGRSIPAKVWAEAISQDISINDVISAFYKTSEFNGSPQLIIEKYVIKEDVEI
jgi:23S rRNA maturation-related 3'-5' exoribonuclease YhaM